MAATMSVARRGQQRSLTGPFHPSSSETARSPSARMRAWARLTAFWLGDSRGRVVWRLDVISFGQPAVADEGRGYGIIPSEDPRCVLVSKRAGALSSSELLADGVA